MQILDGFELGEAVRRAAGLTVHSVRSSSATIRIHEPSPVWRGLPQGAIDAHRDLASARWQKDLAGVCDAVAPVLACGTLPDGRGVYVCVDAPATRLAELIETRARLDAHELRAIVAELLRVVASFHRHAGRGHGRLGPETILGDATSNRLKPRFLLTDPLPPLSAGADVGATNVADLHAIGRIVALLVQRESWRTSIRWPVQSSDAWTGAGRSGEAWRRLANRLLDPKLGVDGSVPDAAALIDELPIEPSRRGVRIAAACAMLATLLAVGGIYWHQTTRGPTEEEAIRLREPMRELATYNLEWYGALRRELESGDPWSDLADETLIDGALQELAGLLEPIRSLDDSHPGVFLPRTYITDRTWRDRGLNNGVLAGGATEEMTADWFVSGRQFDHGRLQTAVETLQSFERDVEAWAIWNQLADIEASWRSRGWPVADRIAVVIESDRRRPSSDWVGDSIDALRAAADATRIEEFWALIEDIDGAVVASPAAHASDELLRSLRERARRALAEHDSIPALRAAADAERPVLSRMLTVLVDQRARVHWDLLYGDADALAELLPRDDVLSRSDLERWLVQTAAYERLDADPRVALRVRDDTVAEIRRIEEGLATLQADEERDATRAALDSWERDVRSLLARPAIVRDADSLRAETERLDEVIGVLAQHSEDLLAQISRPPREYLQDLREVAFGSPALDVAWQARLDEPDLVARLESALAEYGRFRRATQRVRDVFETLDRDALPLEEWPEPRAAWRPETIAAREVAQREAILTELAAVVVDRIRTEPVGFDELSPQIEPGQDALRAWQASARELVRRFEHVQERLELGYQPRETGDGHDRPIDEIASIADVDDDALRAVAADLADAFRPIAARLEAVGVIEALEDGDAVVARIADPAAAERPELLVAAWRRLGDIPFGESDRDIEQDRSALRAVRRWIESLPEATPRRASLERRTRVEAHERWVRHADQLGSIDEWVGAFDRRDEFHVVDEDLEHWMRWNIELTALRRELERTPLTAEHEPLQKTVLAEFLRRSREFAPEALTRQTAAALVADLSALVNDEATPVDPSEIGPARARAWDWEWTFDEGRSAAIPDDGSPPERLVYRRRDARGDHEIEFRLLNPERHPQLDQPTYLAMTEFSVGLFADLARQRREVVGALSEADVQRDGRRGPRTWTRFGNRIELLRDREWLVPSVDRQRWGDYPDGLAVGEIVGDHPMQYIPPHTALYVASLLGCRLPTTAEILAAVAEEFGADATSRSVAELVSVVASETPPTRIGAAIARARLPNLRDATFAAQWEWSGAVESIAAADAAVTRFTPDLDGMFTRASLVERFGIDQTRPAPLELADGSVHDDGVLWFARVDSQAGRRFHHLLGNVMEWVHDDPAALIGTGESVPALPLDELHALMMSDDRVHVIGGSSLAPLEISPWEPVHVQRSIYRRPSTGGYADVGFRLAFTASGRFGTIGQWALRRSGEAYMAAPDRAPEPPSDPPSAG